MVKDGAYESVIFPALLLHATLYVEGDSRCGMNNLCYGTMPDCCE